MRCESVQRLSEEDSKRSASADLPEAGPADQLLLALMCRRACRAEIHIGVLVYGINDWLDQAVLELKAVIIAERCRRRSL